jgi:hypothetical protein
MVYIRVALSEETNRIINKIKKEHGFKNKGQVINYAAERLEKEHLIFQEQFYKKVGKKNIKKKEYLIDCHEKERE